jgi:hypothetical protein
MSTNDLSKTTEEIYSPINKKVVKFPTLNEAEFYEAYLTLDNLTKDAAVKLSSGALALLPMFLAKPFDFTIIFNDKKKSKDKDSKLVLLGKEANVSASYTYLIMKELRDKGILLVDEDGMVIFNEELTILRKGVKANISQYAAMKFEYIFTAKVVEDTETNESNIPRSGK